MRAEDRAAHAQDRAELARAEAAAAETTSGRHRHLREAAVHEKAVVLQRDAARLQEQHVADECARQRRYGN